MTRGRQWFATAAVVAVWCAALLSLAHAPVANAAALPGDLCNVHCHTSADCQTDPNNACTYCVANSTGTLGCTDSACGASCESDNDCDPPGEYTCGFCIAGVCGQGNCNANCQNDTDCAYTPQPPFPPADSSILALERRDVGVPIPVTCPYCWEGSCNTTPYPDCGQPCNASFPCPAPSVASCSECFEGFCLNPETCGKSCAAPTDCSSTRGSECAWCSAGTCSNNACGAVCHNGTDCAGSQCEGCYKGSCVQVCGMPCATSSDCASQDSECEFCVDGQCALSPCPPGSCGVVDCTHAQCGCVTKPERGPVCEFTGPF